MVRVTTVPWDPAHHPIDLTELSERCGVGKRTAYGWTLPRPAASQLPAFPSRGHVSCPGAPELLGGGYWWWWDEVRPWLDATGREYVDPTPPAETKRRR